jgi:Na+-driven multidrug efflux pump
MDDVIAMETSSFSFATTANLVTEAFCVLFKRMKQSVSKTKVMLILVIAFATTIPAFGFTNYQQRSQQYATYSYPSLRVINPPLSTIRRVENRLPSLRHSQKLSEKTSDSNELLSISSNSSGSDAEVEVEASTCSGNDGENEGSTFVRQNITASNQEQYEVPSFTRVVKFAIPAIGVYLCSPMLSMIDTATVGLFCGTLQQAALNPAVTIIDYSARTMSFLYTGTTNMIATSKQKKTADEIKDSFIGSLRFAFLIGTGLGGLILLTSKRMLVPLIGNDTIDTEVIRAAWKYVAIRAFGMPAAAMIGTSQAACLGLQDNKTPFQIIITAAVMNLVLDIALVGRKLPWVGGTAGAAWATTASQYFALGLFFYKFTSSTRQQQPATSTSTSNSDEKILQLSGNKCTKKGGNKLSTKGFLAGRLEWKSFLALPCKKTIQDFSPYIIPVTTTQIGRCSTYIAMGHVVSSTLDTASMAAQQIITSIFYTLIPIGDSCSLAAQSFLPSIISAASDTDTTTDTTTTTTTTTQQQNPSSAKSQIEKPTANNTITDMNQTIKNIYKVAGCLGIFLSLIVISIPFACPLLTSDTAVTSIVQSVVPIMFALLSTHGFFCASEGILLGLRDLKFLGRIYSIFFVVVPILMLRLKYIAKAGVTNNNINLLSVWNVFLGYQTFRILAFLSRVFILRKRFANKASNENRNGR